MRENYPYILRTLMHDLILSLDKYTLTEDFDITVKLLKTKRVVQALSDADVYTEAPVTLKDFVKQRTRWNRGTYQTIAKHRNVFENPRFGYLRNLTFQYLILSMFFVPFVSLASLVVIFISVLIGYAVQVLLVMGVFILIQATYSFLAILMDDKDPKLLIYSPLFVVGHKELRNFLKIRALLDVLTKRQMQWGTLQRVGSERRVPELGCFQLVHVTCLFRFIEHSCFQQEDDC